MPARVNDELLGKAALALCEAADTLTNAKGLRIHSGMNLERAKGAVLGALVVSLGYPATILPTGWEEVTHFGEAANGA